jgi:hypothetical protein
MMRIAKLRDIERGWTAGWLLDALENSSFWKNFDEAFASRGREKQDHKRLRCPLIR